MKTIIPPISLLLLLTSLAGCSEPSGDENNGFDLYVNNESEILLYKRYHINDIYAGGPLWSEAGQRDKSGFTCPSDHPKTDYIGRDDDFTFTLTMEYRNQVVFAKASRVTRCGDEFAAWVHPDGYIVFEDVVEDTDTGYGDPPWERTG